MRGIHKWPVDSPHKGPVRWKMFPFDDIITKCDGLSIWQTYPIDYKSSKLSDTYTSVNKVISSSDKGLTAVQHQAII